MYEIEMNSKPRRAQGGMGLLSRTISIQNPQVSIPLVPRVEREEGKRGAGGGGRQGEGGLRAVQVREKRARGRGGEGVFNPNNSHPKRLNYP